MTGTETIGLPASPIVDANRNLTPEWLHALGEIEQLKGFRDEYAKLADVNTQKLLDAIIAAEQSLLDLLSKPIPNTIKSSNIPDALVSLTTTGVFHELGTASYIPMVRYNTTTTGSLVMNPVTTGADQSMPLKNETAWSYSSDFAADNRTFFTFTINPSPPKGPS